MGYKRGRRWAFKWVWKYVYKWVYMRKSCPKNSVKRGNRCFRKRKGYKLFKKRIRIRYLKRYTKRVRKRYWNKKTRKWAYKYVTRQAVKYAFKWGWKHFLFLKKKGYK